MNTHTAARHITAAHADDLAVVAYLTARQLGQSVEQALRARDSAYAAAMAQG